MEIRNFYSTQRNIRDIHVLYSKYEITQKKLIS